MDTKNIVIICLVVIIAIMAVAMGTLMMQQKSAPEVLNNTTVLSNNSSVNVERINSEEVSSSSEPVSSSSEAEAPVDYNSPDSEYFKYDTDGSYHKKEPGGKYIYAQDAVTGEWSYWADKS